MMITVNLYYTGENGSARRFAEEMENSGTADKIRAEKQQKYRSNAPTTVKKLIDGAF